MFQQWSKREAPVVALIRQRRLKHAEAEQCINFGHAGLPSAPIDAVWTRRVAEGKDALCNWYRSGYVVPGKELLIAEPQTTLQLVRGFTRPSDGWRREVLIEDLSRVLRVVCMSSAFYGGTALVRANKNGPTVCLWLAHPT